MEKISDSVLDNQKQFKTASVLGKTMQKPYYTNSSHLPVNYTDDVFEALDLQDADLEIGDRKGKVTVSQGKGRKQRSVPLNKDARAALMAWLQVKPGGDDNAYIWIAVENEGNGALSQRSVQRVVGRYGQDAEIANLTPHMLRHTFAKNLVDQGVGLEQVATLLGHASLNTTRIYITPSEKDLETAVERLSD